MDSGEFIRDRLIERIIPEVAEELGAECTQFSDGWVFQLHRGDLAADVFGYRFSCNNAAAASIARDKVATSAILASQDIATATHVLVYNHQAGIMRYGEVTGEVVIKPLHGASGHGVHRFVNQPEAEQYIATTKEVAWAIAPWYDIMRETRVITLDGEVLLAYTKQPVVRDNLKMFNLGLGATPLDITIDSETQQLAVSALQSLHLRLAAVDIMELADGTKHVLEVNDGIMMEHYMRVDDEHYQRGYGVYKKIIKAMLD